MFPIIFSMHISGYLFFGIVHGLLKLKFVWEITCVYASQESQVFYVLTGGL